MKTTDELPHLVTVLVGERELRTYVFPALDCEDAVIQAHELLEAIYRSRKHNIRIKSVVSVDAAAFAKLVDCQCPKTRRGSRG